MFEAMCRKQAILSLRLQNNSSHLWICLLLQYPGAQNVGLKGWEFRALSLYESGSEGSLRQNRLTQQDLIHSPLRLAPRDQMVEV
jgi:hypothetical protein